MLKLSFDKGSGAGRKLCIFHQRYQASSHPPMSSSRAGPKQTLLRWVRAVITLPHYSNTVHTALTLLMYRANKQDLCKFFGSDRSSRSHNVCPSVRPSVCLSVPSVTSCLEQPIFIFLGQKTLRELSISNQALRRNSEGTQRELKIRVIPSEPKVLRLVLSPGCQFLQT